MDIIGKKHIFLSISGILVLTSFAFIGMWGLRFGIDFTGGSLLEIEFKEARPDSAEIKKTLEGLAVGTPVVQPAGERGMILRFAHIDEETHQTISARLSGLAPLVEKRFDTIGPTVGAELKRRALLALGLAMVAIILYIAWAFRHVSRPVSSWKYGAAAVLALIHDVTIPTGIFSILGRFKGVEIDSFFIAALLTILGFSVHDTIVVFDRIRENLSKLKVAEPYEITVNRSVNETIARSINTSLTTILVLAAVMVFGGPTVRYLALALLLGIAFGTYSSIFVASPLVVIWNKLVGRVRRPYP